MNLPNSPGYHDLSFATWSLHGNIREETLNYSLDSKPMMNNCEGISRDFGFAKLVNYKTRTESAYRSGSVDEKF